MTREGAKRNKTNWETSCAASFLSSPLPPPPLLCFGSFSPEAFARLLSLLLQLGKLNRGVRCGWGIVDNWDKHATKLSVCMGIQCQIISVIFKFSGVCLLKTCDTRKKDWVHQITFVRKFFHRFYLQIK